MKKVADPCLFNLVRNFFKIYLPNEKKCSIHTIRAYRNALELLFDYIKTKQNVNLLEITFEMIDRAAVASFLEWLEMERGCSVSTRNHRLHCIRAFYAYAANVEPTAVIYRDEVCKVKAAAESKSIVEYMSETAIKVILEQPDITVQKGLRDQFLMLLMYDTGARIQEILDIRLKDISLGYPVTVSLHGKGSKIRSVPIMPKTVEHIQKYIERFHGRYVPHSDQYLFYVDRQGCRKRMTEDNVRRFVNAYGIEAKNVCCEVPDNVHPHIFRHSRAMHLYQHGMALPLISEWLGHSHMETTLIYAYADTELKRMAIEKATSLDSPLRDHLNPERYKVDDEATLKRLYGLR
jgi:site-specific recombinase XerD